MRTVNARARNAEIHFFARLGFVAARASDGVALPPFCKMRWSNDTTYMTATRGQGEDRVRRGLGDKTAARDQARRGNDRACRATPSEVSSLALT